MKKAFTLIEVMLSVAILSVGLILILQGFGRSLGALRISENNLKATFVAENRFSEAQIQAKEDWDVFAEGKSEEFKFEGINCIWEIDIESAGWDEEVSLEEYEDLNTIRARLSWQEGKRKGAIALITYMRASEE
ncbi:MAG: type II secretion system protein [Candidatus Omnitrophota bacterium]|nr:MAG: type II secretion system protein [Candidatus Omnitrophota bacterium]